MKNTNHKLCQFIVKKYVKQNVNWSKEIKIAQKLVKKYKQFNYWNNLNELKLPSLAWFLKEEGKKFLDLQVKVQALEETIRSIPVQLADAKIGEDKNTCQKPKTLIQFIKLWEENQKKNLQ